MGKQKAKHQTLRLSYKDMIEEAINALQQRNGSSRQAILKYINERYTIKERNSTNRHLKLALRAGIRNGFIKQVKGRGVNGSFKIAKSKRSTKHSNTNKDETNRRKALKPRYSASNKNGVMQISLKKSKRTQTSIKKKKDPKSLRKGNAEDILHASSTTKTCSTKPNKTRKQPKAGGKTNCSRKRTENETTILPETAKTVAGNMMEDKPYPDTRESKTNFSTWTNVKLILTDSISVRTPGDKRDVYISSFAMFQDGKIIVADYRNNALKLFDRKGRHLYTTKPEYSPKGLTIGYNSEILVSSFPMYEHIIQIFNVEHDTVSVKGTIETEFEIIGLAAFEDRIIATVVEKDCIGYGWVTAKLFSRGGEVYWTTALETPCRLENIVCVQEKNETLCIVLDHQGTFMAKLNARTGKVNHERSKKLDDENNRSCDIFYFFSESNCADDTELHVCSSDFKHDKIIASREDGLGLWPISAQYDKERERLLIAYGGFSERNDRIDIFNVVDASDRMIHVYRFIGKLNNAKRHAADAFNRVFRQF